jgi:5-methylcytosine-specific restriction endonuclease McrA
MFCGKCGVSKYFYQSYAPWICSNCRKTPEERQKLAQDQIYWSKWKKDVVLTKIANLPKYVKDEVSDSYEFTKFQKSGWTETKERAKIKNKKSLRKMQKRMAKATRRARLLGVPTNYTWKAWMAKVSFYGWRCVYCNLELTMQPKQKNRLTCDHFKALKNGGTHFISNLFPACKSCNSKKWKHKHWKIKFRPSTSPTGPWCPALKGME